MITDPDTPVVTGLVVSDLFVAALVAAGLEQFVANPIMGAGADMFDAAQLFAKAEAHLSRGEYQQAAGCLHAANAKIEQVASVAADIVTLGESAAASRIEGVYETTGRLARGNLGEKLATDFLAAERHHILDFKPSILGTNQGGIDIVTIKDGVVYFVDNKALSRSGNVSSVSALTTNFEKNKLAVLAGLKDELAASTFKEQRDMLASAISAIEAGNFKRVVTNANVFSEGKGVPSGVSKALKDQGIEFIDVSQ
jgi:Holliday junction resolvase-like predicted endonuclease